MKYDFCYADQQELKQELQRQMAAKMAEEAEERAKQAEYEEWLRNDFITNSELSQSDFKFWAVKAGFQTGVHDAFSAYKATRFFGKTANVLGFYYLEQAQAYYEESSSYEQQRMIDQDRHQHQELLKYHAAKTAKAKEQQLKCAGTQRIAATEPRLDQRPHPYRKLTTTSPRQEHFRDRHHRQTQDPRRDVRTSPRHNVAELVSDYVY